ncbi:hypothetical protein AVEN_148275-1, partial [Araneus ventricosus]
KWISSDGVRKSIKFRYSVRQLAAAFIEQ